ncbi:triose-phosphate isomerase [Dictyocaulus viviparus]|uniref:Triosephosphate isomerase n=1 Tax=Dictyocaulus viviparus TaxID=29172 RepID=A0A0D8XII9_DICVI|nr:triose-phosphate isomerase [Dictyocaulus viviparus]
MIVAAQDVNCFSSGAYTGTVSWSQLKDIKINYAIVGHSERRMYYNENDDLVNQKVKSLLENNMVPILCIGERLEEFNAQKINEVCEFQLKNALKNVPVELLSRLIVAYEPIWAIGTGKTSTPENAQKVINHIREVLSTIAGSENAKKVAILYGGSVKPGNIKAIISQGDINGALVGSASLVANNYISLLESC